MLGLDVLKKRYRHYRQGRRDRVLLRHIAETLEGSAAQAGAARRSSDRELVVSLTSFSKRFRHLHLTLDSLSQQTIKPDRIVLYLTKEDAETTTPEIKKRLSAAVELRIVEDLRSYKKLIFALSEFPDADIVTVDDDLIYPPTLLEELVAGREDDNTVICHRAHRVTMDATGAFLPYRSWDWDVQDEAARRPSVDIMPTGSGGVLYPPGALPPQARDKTVFLELCPRADDVWFYWMARMNGACHKKVGEKFVLLEVPQTQQFGLRHDNWGGGNDEQIAAMLARFGPPFDRKLRA